MNEQHTDPEYADPMAGSGISEDIYEEWSGPDEDTPLDDPEADHLTEDDHARGASDDPDEELARLTRDIRRLEDAQGFHLGFPEKTHEYDGDWFDDPEQPRFEGSKSSLSDRLTAEEWVALDVNHRRLGKRFPWELAARVDELDAGPPGMTPKWHEVNLAVKKTWVTQRPKHPRISEGTGHHPENNAIYEITLSLVEDEDFDLDHPATSAGAPCATYYTASRGGPSKETAGIANEVLADLRNPQRDAAICHGYANCCSYPVCLLRSEKTLAELKREDLFERVEDEVRLAQGRIFGLENRGGARKQKVFGKAKLCYPHGHLSGPHHHYNFSAREKGKGAAHNDARAAREYLCADLVEEHGRPWIVKANAGPYGLEDYKRALKRGRKSKKMRAVRAELATRVTQLKADGAFMTCIANVLDSHQQTVRKLIQNG